MGAIHRFRFYHVYNSGRGHHIRKNWYEKIKMLQVIKYNSQTYSFIMAADYSMADIFVYMHINFKILPKYGNIFNLLSILT
jgi:hypothetical protein